MLDEPIQDAGVMANSEGDEALAALRGEIVFSGVHFAYDDATEVLVDLDFTIRPGERVAITGPSGSGKSTTINLLPRFLTPSKGTIEIGGRNTSEMPITSLRSGIGLAFQEVFLFNATIYENLRYARPDATRAEVERACRITGADEVIERLPEGYHTRLSDYGVELSRGEKQRITLARALLKNAPILILDEATASIDRESSRQIMETIFEEVQNRTIIVITHEATLLNLVDRVLSIREGRKDFDGSPEAYIRREYGVGSEGLLRTKPLSPAQPKEDIERYVERVGEGFIEPSQISREDQTNERAVNRFDQDEEPPIASEPSRTNSDEDTHG